MDYLDVIAWAEQNEREETEYVKQKRNRRHTSADDREIRPVDDK